MKLLMRDEAKEREHTIFVTIFSALMVMLAIVVMLMASATAVSGVTLQLDKNAVDILDKQVENRAGYIQDQLQQAQELTDLSTYINETAQQMLDDETLSLKTLDSSSSDSLPLLQAAAPRMLETLRSKRISGIFLILNTHDFTDRTSGDRLPCVYLRDLDPDAVPSVVNSDILLECAPSELVQTFDITTDKAWSPALQYLDGEQDVFYVRPFQTAYEDDERTGRQTMAAGRLCRISCWATTARPSPTRSPLSWTTAQSTAFWASSFWKATWTPNSRGTSCRATITAAICWPPPPPTCGARCWLFMSPPTPASRAYRCGMRNGN